MRNITKLRINTRDILTSMVFGVTAGVFASILERIDTILTGGNATPLGYSNTYGWILLSAYLYGPFGALITTEVQAIIGLLTAANPLSWLWPAVNAVFAIVAGVTALAIQRIRPQSSTKTRIITMSFMLALLDIPAVYFVMVLVLGLPVIVYYVGLPLYIGLQLLPATLIAYLLLQAMERAGLKI
ncbi:MAG: hypothetical protein NWE90_02840 [Candidatus Bathyarchaeota archaeon]|nr:hypothetical protein [Candidatus Bathyarchaeota archaeon]